MGERKVFKAVVTEDAVDAINKAKEGLADIELDISGEDAVNNTGIGVLVDSEYIRDEDYTLEEIAELFVEYAKGFDNPKTAIISIPDFISKVYLGTDKTRFEDVIRMGYMYIVKELLDSLEQEYERTLLGII